MSISRLVLPGLLLLGLISDARATGGVDDGARLVGVWEAVRGDIPAGTTIEFMADHKVRLIGRLPDGQSGIVEGRYELEGDTLRIFYLQGGKRRHKTFKVLSLTDQQLLGADRKGRQEEFRKR